MANTLIFSEVYDEFYVKIHHYMKRIVGVSEAEEVTQVVFEKVSRSLDSFQGKAKISTWIYRIATNTALDKLKSTSFKHSYAGPSAPLPLHLLGTDGIVASCSEKITSPDKTVIREEMSKCVREFVDRLPPDYKTIIFLNEFEGFTNKEIADILDITVDAAKIRLHRARTKLKESLAAGCDFYIDERSELACDRKQPNKKDPDSP